MKKLITILGIAAMLFAGCSNPVETSVEPIVSDSYTFNKENEFGTSSFTALPNELSTAKEIKGTNGGNIILNGTFRNTYGDMVTVQARLSIPSNAFTGTKNISIRTTKVNPNLVFQPAGNFEKALKADITFSGLDLTRYGISNGRCDFVYIADNGTVTVIKNQGIVVNTELNTVEVKGAEITHFSRYGFIRKSEKNGNSTAVL